MRCRQGNGALGRIPIALACCGEAAANLLAALDGALEFLPILLGSGVCCHLRIEPLGLL
jgi:hypothetical protein